MLARRQRTPAAEDRTSWRSGVSAARWSSAACSTLQPGLSEYELIVGEVDPFPQSAPPPPRNQIVARAAVDVRGAQSYLSHGVTVPPEHLEHGLVRQTELPDGQLFDWGELTRGVFEVQHVQATSSPGRMPTSPCNSGTTGSTSTIATITARWHSTRSTSSRGWTSRSQAPGSSERDPS